MKKTFILEDLCCANCAAKMENGIRALKGVNNVSLSFMTQRLTLDLDEENSDAVLKEIRKIIKKIDSDVEMVEK